MSLFRKKRILVFNDSLALAGTEKLLVNLLNHMVEKKCEVTLILPVPSIEDVLLPDVSEDVQVKYLYRAEDSRFVRKKGEIRMIFATKSFLKSKGISEDNFDEVVCFKESFFAKMLSGMDIPKTLWLHNILYVREYEIRSLKERLAVWLNKKQIIAVQNSYALYDRVICVSEACKQSYINIVFDGRLPIQDIRIVPNAIKLDQVIERSKDPIENLPQAITKFILLTRVSPDKRIDRLINAVKRLTDEGYEFLVYVLGSGTDGDDYKNGVEHLGLRNVIQLLGKVDNPYPYVLQSNWLLCVSERESFSLALLEAMALGTPVITTNCGGPAGIVDNGKYGILVDNSADGVYEGMKSVLDDPTLSVRYSSELVRSISRYNFDNWLRTVDKLLSI